ncbi:MAG: lipopolysaccharide transport periplasmic protein LptA [Halioglobus sp.]
MSSHPSEGTPWFHRAAAVIRPGIALAGLIGVLLSSTTAALPDDRQQPIRITADQAIRNEKAGYTVYNGNVEMNQGSLQIRADKITIFRLIEEGDKIVAKGQPAVMQQQPDPDKGLLTARAGIIEYYKLEARVHLKQNAIIEQDGSKVTGETIDYFIDEQMVKAGSDRAREDSRVEVVIPATNLQQSEGDSGAANSE